MKFDTRNWLTKRKVISVALLLLVALYGLLEPKLDEWTGWDWPGISGDNQQNVNNDSGGDSEQRFDFEPSPNADGFKLETLPDGTKRSPAGLIYTKNRRETRIEHVMRHAKDNQSRPVHGVFDANSETDVLALIDEAYELVKQNSNLVKGQKSQQDSSRMEYWVNMQRRIGMVGGQKGKRDNFPAANYVKLVLADNRVITAYPDDKP